MVYITPHKMNTLLRQPTAFEKYLEREKMSAEQAAKSEKGREWIRKHATSCFIPEPIIKAAGVNLKERIKFSATEDGE